MKKTIFIISTLALALLAFFILINAKKPENQTSQNSQISIVSANFIGYDLARAITKDTDASIQILLKPGTEAHTYEPTPSDIIAIKNADLSIYNGGESDEWVKDILADNNIPADKTLRLMDTVDLKEEEITEGMEQETNTEGTEDAEDTDSPEYDEHIWTSIPNTIKILDTITQKLAALSPQNAAKYQENQKSYQSELENIDQQIRTLVENSTKKELIFGDRFPFRYFTDEYELNYFAAFPGCAEQTEASSRTVAFLIDKVNQDHIPVVLKIELSSGNLAETIANATGTKVLELHSAHNISAEDFENGVTYVDLLQRNLTVLSEALK